MPPFPAASAAASRLQMAAPDRQALRWLPPLRTAAKFAAVKVAAHSLFIREAQALGFGSFAVAALPAAVLFVGATAMQGAVHAVMEVDAPLASRETAGAAARGAMNATLKAARELRDWVGPALPALGVLAVVGGAVVLSMHCASTLDLSAMADAALHVARCALDLALPMRAIGNRWLGLAVSIVRKDGQRDDDPPLQLA